MATTTEGQKVEQDDEERKSFFKLFDKIYKDGHRAGIFHGLEGMRQIVSMNGTINLELLDCLEGAVSRRDMLEDYGSYNDYLQSNDWKEKAKRLKEQAEWRCQLCNKKGTNSTLHAHHKTYQRVGHEEDNDIIILCSKCHAMFHNKGQHP